MEGIIPEGDDYLLAEDRYLNRKYDEIMGYDVSKEKPDELSKEREEARKALQRFVCELEIMIEEAKTLSELWCIKIPLLVAPDLLFDKPKRGGK